MALCGSRLADRARCGAFGSGELPPLAEAEACVVAWSLTGRIIGLRLAFHKAPQSRSARGDN